MSFQWTGIITCRTVDFICGYCNKQVASCSGWDYVDSYSKSSSGQIRICPNCQKPTFIGTHINGQIPGIVYGCAIEFLPQDIEYIYNEARNCFSLNAYTSVIMCCRKLLMHIACKEGAGENLAFGKYVQYLKDNGYVTKPGQAWADSILKMGNIANHTLECYEKEDAELIMKFTEMMLKTIYETPGLHKQFSKKQKE